MDESENWKSKLKIMPCATSDKEKVLISMQICDCLSHNNDPPHPTPAFYAKAGA